MLSVETEEELDELVSTELVVVVPGKSTMETE